MLHVILKIRDRFSRDVANGVPSDTPMQSRIDYIVHAECEYYQVGLESTSSGDIVLKLIIGSIPNSTGIKHFRFGEGGLQLGLEASRKGFILPYTHTISK